ncbi:hypothetical protein NP493_237g00010 [Ridgeia piscesae]|uniref:Uncharacterized protein n=1 Tax=Ridgeia piscesae TaxID=27915 RepID=A0AAD9NZL2_RIDPI|nr:hypothetical protein NP493_237g00010 [Ridgeia piscesae]
MYHPVVYACEHTHWYTLVLSSYKDTHTRRLNVLASIAGVRPLLRSTATSTGLVHTRLHFHRRKHTDTHALSIFFWDNRCRASHCIGLAIAWIWGWSQSFLPTQKT